MKNKMIKNFSFPAILIFFYLSSCGGGGSPSLGLNIKIYSPSPDTGINSFDGVQFLKITLTAPDLKPPIVKDNIPYSPGGNIELSNIPYGNSRQITLDGCAEKCSTPNALKARGRSIPVSIKKGEDAKEVNIYVTPVNSFAPTSSSKTKTITTLNFKHRVGASYTLLNDGSVLIAGGASAQGLDWMDENSFEKIIPEAEIYDPNTGEFIPTFGSMNIPRAFHTATKLPDGKVVIIGGVTYLQEKIQLTSSVEYYDPLQKKFIIPSQNSAKNLPMPRAFHTATHIKTNLANPDLSFFDAIFVAGGKGDVPGYWEIFVFNVGVVYGGESAKLKQARWNHTATYVDKFGKNSSPSVVIFGGENQAGIVSTLEVFDVNTNKMNDEFINENPPGGGRVLHTAPYLKEQGIIYFIGGFINKEKTTPTNRIDIYRTAEGKFSGEILWLNIKRGAHQSTIMEKNSILVTGGRSEGGVHNTAEVIFEFLDCSKTCQYVVDVASLGEIPTMRSKRMAHGAIFLPTKTVLIVGGFESESPLSLSEGAEIYNPMEVP